MPRTGGGCWERRGGAAGACAAAAGAGRRGRGSARLRAAEEVARKGPEHAQNAALVASLYQQASKMGYSPLKLPKLNLSTTKSMAAEQLQRVASVSVGSEADYQLVYKDEAEPDYYSDYGLEHSSDEYLDYLYQIYDDLDNGITYYDTEYVDNDATQLVNMDQDDLSGAISRSGEAEGRAVLEEDITEPEGQLFENVVPPVSDEVTAGTVVNKLEYVDKFLNISKIEETREETTETTIEDFVVDVELLKTSTNNNSDIYIKIGIFITVSLAMLVMTGKWTQLRFERHPSVHKMFLNI